VAHAGRSRESLHLRHVAVVDGTGAAP
jgi:hypothetical protein